MRISDWSSDVCSSDLLTLGGARYHAGYYESSRLVPYPPGFGRTAIAQKTAEISRFLDVLGRPRKYKWCPEEELNWASKRRKSDAINNEIPLDRKSTRLNPSH